MRKEIPTIWISNLPNGEINIGAAEELCMDVCACMCVYISSTDILSIAYF